MPADSCPRCRRPLATYDDEMASIGGVDVPDGLCWRGVQSSAESDCQIAAERACADALAREVVALRDALATAKQERNAAQGIAPDDERRHTLLLHLTPHLLGRVQALGYAPGETPEGLLPWLVAGLEEARKGEVEAVGRKGERWFVVHQRDGQPFVETFIGAGAERAAKLTARAHVANWTDTYVMQGREVSSADFEREAREELAASMADRGQP